MSKRRNKRINQTVTEFNAAVIDVSAQSALETVPDEALFTVDRQGSKASKQKIAKEKVVEQETKTTSKVEQKLIKRALQNQKDGISKSKTKSKLISAGNDDERIESLNDLWGDTELSNKRIKTNKSKATESALKVLPGQSYNPSVDAHQDALAKAVALEEKKIADIAANELADSRHAALRSADSVVDINFQGDFSEEEEEDEYSEDDDDEEDGSDEPQREKKKKVLTQADRNKKRERQLLFNDELQEKIDKQLLKSINAAPDVLRKMEKKEQRAVKAKEMKDAKKKLDEDAARKALNYDEAGNIPLSDELGGSLRTIVPKGVAVVERARRMKDEGMLIEKRKKGKKKTDHKHHGSSNIVWHPKYKLPREAMT